MAKQQWKGGNMLYPVPVVMVSCCDKNNYPNIITIAWCGTCCSNPPMVSISVRKDRYSYQLLKETGSFVINLVTKDLTEAADFCGVKSGKDTNKFLKMHLTPQKSLNVLAPGIEESPVNIECKIKEVIPLGSHDMFLAKVVGVIIEDSYLDGQGRFQLEKANLVAYMHGGYYAVGKLLGTFGFSVKKGKGSVQKHGKS